MKNIIVNDPEDEKESITDPIQIPDKIQQQAGAVQQQEGLSINPSYMNGYG